MKTRILNPFGIVAILLFLLVNLMPSDAQQRNIKTELLVYILRDSLELPALEKGNIDHTKANILSKSLKAAFDNVKPISLGKAMPNWNDADSIKTREDGMKVKAPEFGRIFTLVFKSEAEADAAAKILQKIPAVLFAEKNSQPQLFNDPRFINGDQWHLNNDGRNGGVAGADIHAAAAWNIFTGNPNITIAVFDTGFELTHEELINKSSGDAFLEGTPGAFHGTHVAAIAAGNSFNALGGRGVDWNARLLSARIFGNGNPSYTGDADVATKISAAVNSNAQVFNHSWGGTPYSTTLAMAFAFAYKMNRVSVAAMGNDNVTTINYPAGYNNVIAVGATTNTDSRAPFSNTGNHIDVCAPGGISGFIGDNRNILSATLNNGYEFIAGTSQATPQVSGLASLLKGFNNNLSNDDIENIIELSADDRGTAGWDQEYGFGRINAERALNFLRPPFNLNQWIATGGTDFSSTNNFVIQFLGAPGLASGNYVAKRHEVTKTVTFPKSFCQLTGAWGRGVSTSGWRYANPNYGEGFCEVVPGTSTNTGVTLRTYVYEVYSMRGQYLGYYPSTPENVTFAYSALGVESTINGADPLCSTGQYSLQIIPSGTTISWSSSNPGGIQIDPSSGWASRINNFNGTATVTATYNGGVCNGVSANKTVYVGLPSANTNTLIYPNGGRAVDPVTLLPNTVYQFNSDFVPGASSFTWMLPSGFSFVSGQGTSNPGIRTSATYGNYTLYCTADNACGSNWTHSLGIIIDGSCIICPRIAQDDKPPAAETFAKIALYPNPANTELKVRLTAPAEHEGELSLMDLSGNVNRNEIIQKGTQWITLRTTDIFPGMYVIKVNDGSKVYYRKVLVQH